MLSDRKIILYIAASLDGYIAKPNDDLSFLDMVQEEGEDYGYAAFLNTIDTVIVGRKTYEWVLQHVPEYVHVDRTSFVITRTPRPSVGNIHFYTGSLKDLVRRLKSEQGKNVFVDGGAETVNALLKDNLIDEVIISVIPVLLGSGIRLFDVPYPEQKLQLVSVKQFNMGLVQMSYKIDIRP